MSFLSTQKRMPVSFSHGNRTQVLGRTPVGYNDNMGNSTETLSHELQQCDSWEGFERCAEKHGFSWDDYSHEIKWDGFRLCAYVHEDHVDFFTRHGKQQNGKLPKVEAELLAVFPAGTVLDGEIVAPMWDNDTGLFSRNEDGIVDVRFQYVQSVMLSLPERAVEVQDEQGYLTFAIFDSPALEFNSYRGRWLSLFGHMQLAGCAQVEEGWRYGSLFMQNIEPASEQRHVDLVSQGFEGSVLKNVRSMYGQRLKGHGWFKWKTDLEIDAVILGFHDGLGKFSDTVGSIVFGQPYRAADLSIKSQLTGADVMEVEGEQYVVRGSCSGLTDEVRYGIYTFDPDGAGVIDRREELMGTVITLAHKGVMHGGVRFRFPQFKRFRPDKPASQVYWHDH